MFDFYDDRAWRNCDMTAAATSTSNGYLSLKSLVCPKQRMPRARFLISSGSHIAWGD